MSATTGTHPSENLSQSVNDLISEGGHTLASDDKRVSTKASWNNHIAHLTPEVRARLMAKYLITYNGLHYEKDGYRYEELADAVRYAKIQRSLGKHEIAPKHRPESIETPNESQRSLMNKLGITFQDGVYHFETFCYEHLSDAIDYAQLQGRLPVKP
jgi:hypothetical protein